MKTKYPYLLLLTLIGLLVSGCATAASAPTVLEHPCSMDAIAAFHSAGLNAEVIRGASKDERDGLFPFGVRDSQRFRISTNEAEMGTVVCFENRTDLEQVQNYYLALNRSLPQFSSRLYVKDNVLLQINHEVSEPRARAYAAVLYSLDE